MPKPPTLKFLLLIADSDLVSDESTGVFAWFSLDRAVTSGDLKKIRARIEHVKSTNHEWNYEDLEVAVERQLEEMGYICSGAAEEAHTMWTNPPGSGKDALVSSLVSLIKARGSSDVIFEIIGDLNLTTRELEAAVEAYEKQFYTTPGAAHVDEIGERHSDDEDMWWEGPQDNPKLEGERRALAERLAVLVKSDPRTDDPALSELLSRLTRPEIEFFIERCGASA